MNIHDTPRAGLLIGHGAISAYLNLDPRAAAAFVSKGTLPAFGVGDLIVAQRQRLAVFLDPTPAPLHPSDWRGHEQRRRAEGDELDGMGAVAAYLNATYRQARALVAAGLPCDGHGESVQASKSRILKWLAEQEGNANG